MSHDLGIFTSPDDASFKSDRTIKRELALEGQLPPIYKTPLISLPDLHKLLDIAEQRKISQKEISPVVDGVLEIQLPETSIINIMGDLHFGDLNTDNQRIAQELEVIKNTPNSYLLLIGDMVNGIWWGGASQSEQVATNSEQHQFLRALFREMKGKVLMGVSGEHDSKWASKTGADPYMMMYEESGAPYVRGTGEISLDVGEQNYKLVVAHKMRGHSMYNKNHPTYREARFNLQGADVYIAGHTHQKQVSQESIRDFGGSRLITHISIGPYKTGDEYGDRSGFVHQTPNEMYGSAIRVHSDTKQVEVMHDIVSASKVW